MTKTRVALPRGIMAPHRITLDTTKKLRIIIQTST